MKINVTETMFKDAFAQADRLDNFSREGLGILFDYLESVEQDTGEELELDVVALCCDYYEQDARSVNDDYSLELDLSDMDDNEAAELVADEISDRTSVVGVTSAGTVIFQAF